MKCGKNLWRGEAFSDDQQAEENYEVSVVMSYCDEDISLFMNYIDDRSDNITIR